MGIGSGLGGQAGWATETAYGVYTAPDHFQDIDSETWQMDSPPVQDGGINAGQFMQEGTLRQFPTEAATGTVSLSPRTKKFGWWLNHILGSGTVVPVQQGAGPAYLQTHVVGDNYGKSATHQFGLPNRGGTSYVKTIKGVKVLKAEFSCDTTGILKATIDCDGQRLSEVETLAAYSPVPGMEGFSGKEMYFKIGTLGSEAQPSGVKKVTLAIERKLDVDAIYAGAAIPGTKDEPVMEDNVVVSGSVDVDFKAKADFQDRVHGKTSTALQLGWQKAVAIAATYYPFLNFAVPQIWFPTGSTYKLSDNGVLMSSFPFEATRLAGNAPITATYQSVDTTL